MSGISPFDGTNAEERSRNIAKGKYQFDSSAFGQVSSEAKDFIQRLLVVNGPDRMNIYEALEHPWFTGNVRGAGTLSTNHHRDLLKRLHEKKADYERSILALGRTAGSGYGSLRRNRLKEFNLYESRFDRRELAPRIIRKPIPCVVGEGQAAVLSCVIYALSPPIITWFAPGAKPLHQCVKYLQLSSGDTYTLKVSRSEIEDEGEYSVRAENSFGSREASTTITVVPMKHEPLARNDSFRRRVPQLELAPIENDEVDSKPVVTFHLRDRLIQQGDYCKLLCCISGKPRPHIEWEKDGRSLEATRDTTIGFSNGVASFEIISCKTEDGGRYICKAKNSLGESETSCLVRVEAQPAALRRPSYSGTAVRRVDFRERSCEPSMLRSQRAPSISASGLSSSVYVPRRHASPGPMVIAGAYIHHPSLSHSSSWSSLYQGPSTFTRASSISRTTNFTSGSNFHI